MAAFSFIICHHSHSGLRFHQLIFYLQKMVLEKCTEWAKLCSGTMWSKTSPHLQSPHYVNRLLERQNFKKKIFGFHHLEGVLYLLNFSAASDVIGKYWFCQFDSLLHSSWVLLLFIVLCFNSWLWIKWMSVFCHGLLIGCLQNNILSWKSFLNSSCRNHHGWANFKSRPHFIHTPTPTSPQVTPFRGPSRARVES